MTIVEEELSILLKVTSQLFAPSQILKKEKVTFRTLSWDKNWNKETKNVRVENQIMRIVFTK